VVAPCTTDRITIIAELVGAMPPIRVSLLARTIHPARMGWVVGLTLRAMRVERMRRIFLPIRMVSMQNFAGQHWMRLKKHAGSRVLMDMNAASVYRVLILLFLRILLVWESVQ
jgi:hypothetical protein